MELLDFGNELLKREPKEFDFEEHDAKEFCDALFKKQKELGGIGLSANQVGLDAKVFVFGDGKDIQDTSSTQLLWVLVRRLI